MKVLLDENLPHKLRLFLSEFETITAVYAGFGGYKNGALLSAAEAADFDVLLTGDLSMEYQQNLIGKKLAIVSLSDNRWQIVKQNLPAIREAIAKATPGVLTRVDCIVPRTTGPS